MVCTCMLMHTHQRIHMEVRGPPWALVFTFTLFETGSLVRHCEYKASWSHELRELSYLYLPYWHRSTKILDLFCSIQSTVGSGDAHLGSLT